MLKTSTFSTFQTLAFHNRLRNRLLLKSFIFLTFQNRRESIYFFSTFVRLNFKVDFLMNTVTLKDIAKLLGISKSTVSRALKNHPDISQKTKDAVMQLSEALHYRPNAVAVSFRFKKSKVIGLIVPQISAFFFPSVIEGIEHELYKHHYNLMILQSNESYEREVEACNILLSNNVEGILASVSRETENFGHFEDIVNDDLPIVFFDRVPNQIKGNKVLVDDIDGAFKATKHLIEIGRTKIAICIGNPNLLISDNRLNGYIKAMQKHNFEIDKQYIISGESPEDVEEKMSKLINLPEPPDAIFAISDLTMSGIMKAINRSNLKIPEDIAVIGFCEEPFSSMYSPPLSTIKPMGYEIGQKAAQLLFKRINGQAVNRLDLEVVFLQSELIVSESTVRTN